MKSVFERGDLELLLALAESGSLARAAQALGVHHATAFRRLADMEHKAGSRLFDRLPGGYQPSRPPARSFSSRRACCAGS